MHATRQDWSNYLVKKSISHISHHIYFAFVGDKSAKHCIVTECNTLDHVM